MKKQIYCAVIGALSALSQQALAEHEGVIHLDEISVEAPRPNSVTQPDAQTAREQLDKTPGGVTLIEAEQFREGRVSNYNDTLGMASGVLAQSRFGSEETRLSIRGSGLQRTFHGRGLKLMQDGIPVNLADGSFDFPAIDPYATSYIEVYRGANALQYGASNLGGSINFISPTGYTAPRFEVRGETGSFGYQRLGIQTGGVIDSMDYFVSVSGYSQNSFRDDADQDAQRVNGNVGYKISDTVETRFYFGYTNNDSELPGNLSKAQLRKEPEDSQNKANPGDPILSGTGVWERNIDLWRLANKTTFTWDNTKLDVGVFYSNKDLYHPIVDLAYLSFLPFPPFSTGTFATLGVIDQKTDDYGLTMRLQHTGEIAGMKNEFVVGLSPTYGEIEDKRFRNLNGHKGTMTNNFDLTARNFEAYVQDTLHVTPELAVIAGLQYTDSKRKAKDKFINPATGDESYNESYSQASPKLGLLYNLDQHVQLFANYSRSFEPPSFGELVNPAIAKNLKAQKGNSFEIGTRGNSEYIDWDVALYYAKMRDEMLAVSPFPGNTDTVNADKTIHVGLEMGMTARLPMSLEWRHNLLVNRFKFDNDDTFGDNRLAGIPRVLMRAELLYRGNHFLPGFYFGPTVEWSPERYNVDFAETLYADNYTIWGLKMGQHVNDHWSWFLEGRNLGDKKYAASTDVLKQANATGSDRAFLPGDGRSVYAGFTWRY
ncbi:MAG TPA: TonB-dependent receptor [Methylophilus sp.]|nr:TonB-dependent receptor [Methylophilus sp.]HQQ34112.1 TonB-dependent receptor [Methylophilus sp.]